MLIFLDVETTGLEVDDKICSLAIIYEEKSTFKSLYELVDEGKKIPPKASSIHHITNEMIRGEKCVLQSDIYQFLQEHNNESTIIVGHNIGFDMKKLLACGYEFKGLLLDTLRVSKHLIEGCESYALQVLRYDLKLYKYEKEEASACGIKEEIIAHNAIADTVVLKLLFHYLQKMKTIEDMCALSFKNVLLHKFPFGKYEGRYIEEITTYDRSYIEWMLNSISDLDEDLRYSIVHNLQG
ncbi:3'-5' exonuclease [Sulfurimonas sp. SAG-AH-194-I05]|nr:exonuclease domain-containing protein [Sulfurimonas sp. SAG-AH-194-I05]MDF1874317.1 3'-5' exonuclease [Sulfurimonas sp. SAG-AH-194-I05]